MSWEQMAAKLRKGLRANKISHYRVAVEAKKEFGISHSSVYRALVGEREPIYATSWAVIQVVKKLLEQSRAA